MQNIPEVTIHFMKKVVFGTDIYKVEMTSALVGDDIFGVGVGTV